MTLDRFEHTQLGQQVEFVGEVSCPRYTDKWYLAGTIVNYHYDDLDRLLSCDLRLSDGTLIENVNHSEID